MNIQEAHIQVLNTEVPSFQGVGIEGFHRIQRCPHFTGVGIEGFHCIQRCPHFTGVRIEGFHLVIALRYHVLY